MKVETRVVRVDGNAVRTMTIYKPMHPVLWRIGTWSRRLMAMILGETKGREFRMAVNRWRRDCVKVVWKFTSGY